VVAFGLQLGVGRSAGDNLRDRGPMAAVSGHGLAIDRRSSRRRIPGRAPPSSTRTGATATSRYHGAARRGEAGTAEAG